MIPCKNLAASGPATEMSPRDSRGASPEDGGLGGGAVELENGLRCRRQLTQALLVEVSITRARGRRFRMLVVCNEVLESEIKQFEEELE